MRLQDLVGARDPVIVQAFVGCNLPRKGRKDVRKGKTSTVFLVEQFSDFRVFIFIYFYILIFLYLYILICF